MAKPWTKPQRSMHRVLGRVLRRLGAGRLVRSSPPIAELGVIGDRCTAAIVTRDGEIAWFCPGRFDAPSLLGSLLDPDVGGAWRIELEGGRFVGRRYLGSSAVLETTLRHPNGRLTVTDWMPLSDAGGPSGAICRSLGHAPAALRMVLAPRPRDGRRVPRLRNAGGTMVVIDERFRLQASHPAVIRGGTIVVHVPPGEPSWAVLSDGAGVAAASAEALGAWQATTERSWHVLAERGTYDGPFADAVQSSLRALRLLTYESTGAIAAAVTTSLPEVIGGKRNFDYRYSWLRDSGMIVRALVRFEPDGAQARRYLGYVAGLLDRGYRSPLDPVAAVGGERVPPQRKLAVAGYRDGHPNLTGNKAAKQLQLGSLANFVLAASEVYGRCGHRDGWDAAADTANFLSVHWRDRANGIWEEAHRRHYTSGLVLSACALERIAPHAGSESQAEAWRRAAAAIRDFVSASCCTPEGTFGAIAGSTAVDMSAALFPVWDYVPADDPGMVATVEQLQRQYGLGAGLFHRHLQNRKVTWKEGAFLAGTFWVAHYWVKRGALQKATEQIARGLTYANDLGPFSEEIDPRNGNMLGNLPLGLVHGSFLAAVADLHAPRPDRSPGHGAR
ncbi:MAG: glycoside hydrolase family 15 protein [Pseudomonadota bacterium]|nr:glycoside hydrolase family 15 protein [Pseudomonadota bacterium]